MRWIRNRGCWTIQSRQDRKPLVAVLIFTIGQEAVMEAAATMREALIGLIETKGERPPFARGFAVERLESASSP